MLKKYSIIISIILLFFSQLSALKINKIKVIGTTHTKTDTVLNFAMQL